METLISWLIYLYLGLYTPVLHRVKYLLYCVAISDVLPPREGETYPPSSDYATKNYPPPGDSTYSTVFPLTMLLILKFPLILISPATSSGGRRTGPVSHLDSERSPSGNTGLDRPELRGQQEREAPQGRDPSAESLDTRKEAAEALAARYRASRERLHEGHGSGVNFVSA